MAIALDGTTPAGVSQATATTSALTTASFTAPAGSVLVASWQGNTGVTENPSVPTISDTGGLTWTSLGVRNFGDDSTPGQAALWWALAASSAARTVTVNNLAASGNRHARLKVLVLSGVDNASPVASSGEGNDTGGALDTLTVTTVVANSWVIGSVGDWDVASTTFTAGAATTIADSATVPTNAWNAATLRNTTPGASGSSVSLGLTLPTSTKWQFVWVEMRPDLGLAGGAAPRVLVVPSSAAMQAGSW